MSFEIIFITEGTEARPAVEIQYSGQRLCVISSTSAGGHKINFVQDLYVGLDIEMAFPLQEFISTINTAATDLDSWVQQLALDNHEA